MKYILKVYSHHYVISIMIELFFFFEGEHIKLERLLNTLI